MTAPRLSAYQAFIIAAGELFSVLTAAAVAMASEAASSDCSTCPVCAFILVSHAGVSAGADLSAATVPSVKSLTHI